MTFDRETTETTAGGGEQTRLVLFDLCGEAYGIGLGTVQEVIKPGGVTRIPQTPGFVEGVINLRGAFVPVVDLGKRFGLGAVTPGRQARILIVELEDQLIGVAVDGVAEVASVDSDEIEPPSPLIRSAIKSGYLEGFVELNGALVKILNMERVFSPEELAALRGVEDSEPDAQAPMGGGAPD